MDHGNYSRQKRRKSCKFEAKLFSLKVENFVVVCNEINTARFEWINQSDLQSDWQYRVS